VLGGPERERGDAQRLIVIPDDLLATIREVFPAQPLESEAIIEHSCPECADVAGAFGGLAWPEVNAEAIDSHFQSLPLFSPAAFQQFLPAFLTRALERADDPTGINDVLEFTHYALLPEQVDEWWLGHVGKLTDLQAMVVLRFIEHAQARSGGYLGEPPTDALEYWRGRVTGRRTS